MNNKLKICIQEKGQLGNKMFQAAAGIALALRTAAEFVKTDKNNLGDHAACEVIWKNVPAYIGSDNFTPYREPYYHYKQITQPDSNTVLMGYFQSCKYFEDYKQEVLELFSPSPTVKQKVAALLSNYTNLEESCALHVRRGDYLNYPDSHPTQEVSYYEQAASFFSKDTLFVICSDDIQWCKQNLSFLPCKVFVEGNKNYEDLYLMASCHHNIIANSTFSWWSAYMNTYSEKKNNSAQNVCR
jgi:hypothetical protein